MAPKKKPNRQTINKYQENDMKTSVQKGLVFSAPIVGLIILISCRDSYMGFINSRGHPYYS